MRSFLKVFFFFVFCFNYNKYSHTIQHPSDLATREKSEENTMFSTADCVGRSAQPKNEKRVETGRWPEGEEGKRSLLHGLIDRGVGVQAGGIGVHELGGVVGSHGGHAAVVGRVGDAWHDGHDLCDLLLQVLDLLVLLEDLPCETTEERQQSQPWSKSRKGKRF